jgi:cobalt-zinc-cadmium efflux system outer membrane protein
MFKQLACLSACCLLISGLSLSGTALAQEAGEPSPELVEAYPIRQLVDEILATHPSVLAAQAAVDAAEARERSADRPLYNPDLMFDIEDAVDTTYEVGIFQTVDWSGKKKAAFAASSARRSVVELEYHIAQDDLTGQILSNLSKYWSAVEFTRLASRSVDIMHEFAQQSKSRYDAGDMNKVEYETAVLAYTDVRMRQADADSRLAESIRELTTLGAREDLPTWPRMPGTLPELTIQPGEVDRMVSKVPTVKVANGLVATASAEVEIAKQKKKPDPTLGFRIGEEDDDSLVGFSFSIPLYIRNNFDEDLVASMAVRSQAQADAAAIERNARARLLVAMERYMNMRDAWKIWEESGASSIERRAQALQELWDVREINMSEFQLQVRQTLETRSTAFELRENLWDAWIEYLDASDQLEDWPQNFEAQSEKSVEQNTMRNN